MSSCLGGDHKEAVKAWVPKVRRILEEELEAQLDRLGLKPTGKHTPVEKMRLPEEAARTRRRVEALLARDRIAEGTAKRGFDNVKRELAYTVLNRLVGLKAMEARGLLYLPAPAGFFHYQDTKDTKEESKGPDFVSSCPGESPLPEQTELLTPVPGQAYSRYLRDFRAAGGSRYKYDDDAEQALLRDGLTAAFRHITGEIGVLFDPDHEYACVWPPHATLTRVIRMINEDLPEDAYRARDFLGWVYQFFNREEKKRVRDENKGTPRSSYELAVINQFYTPSWVVKALVDNTLGRLWVQMHPDSSLAPTAPPPLPDERPPDLIAADYLVPRTGERIRYQRLDDAGQVQMFKRARDLALLDPACGTMHFGQYAFGLFHRMYLDEIEHAGEAGWPEEPSVKEPREIPAAILEHNLFGIDIDPRAIQIASLSLMLTAKESALQHGFSPLNVRIRRTNLVVANAVNLGQDRLRALVQGCANHQGTKTPRAADRDERLFEVVWENLAYVSELGSLVQVRESVAQVLDEWVDARAREKGLTRLIRRRTTQRAFDFMQEITRSQAHQLELERKVLEDEARQIEAELLAAIEAAAAQATEDPSDRIFAEDTARGLKLLQALSRKYDVVVMNPPYGAFVPAVKDFVKAAYPLTSNDIYAAFIDRATQLTEPEGYVGALVSATFVNLKSFEKLRTEILLKRNPLVAMLDLGFGILDDATVEAAAIVLRGGVR
ncbi:MAG: Eco57I restriction-modification methylase domain-containing protein [Candidatus Schekmanbacteria bacterium]|nr:Eco57I restriction-modification methylase domain-containing protein [Candidatus Schekmanbacteria bacterium]